MMLARICEPRVYGVTHMENLLGIVRENLFLCAAAMVIRENLSPIQDQTARLQGDRGTLTPCKKGEPLCGALPGVVMRSRRVRYTRSAPLRADVPWQPGRDRTLGDGSQRAAALRQQRAFAGFSDSPVCERLTPNPLVHGWSHRTAPQPCRSTEHERLMACRGGASRLDGEAHRADLLGMVLLSDVGRGCDDRISRARPACHRGEGPSQHRHQSWCHGASAAIEYEKFTRRI